MFTDGGQSHGVNDQLPGKERYGCNRVCLGPCVLGPVRTGLGLPPKEIIRGHGGSPPGMLQQALGGQGRGVTRPCTCQPGYTEMYTGCSGNSRPRQCCLGQKTVCMKRREEVRSAAEKSLFG